VYLLIVLRSLLVYFLLFLLCVIFFIPVAIYFIVPVSWRARSRALTAIVYCFYRGVLWCTLLPVRYVGTCNMPTGPVIIVANHQSALDIPLLGSLAGCTTHVWLATTYLLKSPVLRFVLPRTCVLVDTSSQMKAMRSLLTAIKLVNDGHHGHLLLFPEGGRFTDGTVHEFFAGFVLLAKETKRPIVPVFIDGVAQAYAPDAFLVRQVPLTVTIGRPLYYDEHTVTDKAFKDMVYNWFLKQSAREKNN
jgi:1-acyl-sn-glycerol-3-phosphate acyltransferase